MVDRESIQGSHSEGYGPHGGPLVAIEGGFVEISVFETNTPPRFRLSFFDERQRAVAPPPGAVEIETPNPARERQPFAVRVGDALLKSNGSME
jgi:hypothetical protein